MTYIVKPTKAFKRDFKLAKKRNLPIDKLKAVVDKLANDEELPPANRDHALYNNWVGHRECHITPDWLLIYQIHGDSLILELTRTGTHSDLFG